MPRPWKACREGLEMGKAQNCEIACGSGHNSDLCTSYKNSGGGRARVLYKACKTGLRNVKKWVKDGMTQTIKAYHDEEKALRRRLSRRKHRRKLRRKSNLRPTDPDEEASNAADDAADSVEV